MFACKCKFIVVAMLMAIGATASTNSSNYTIREFSSLLSDKASMSNQNTEKIIEYFGYAPDVVVSYAASHYYKKGQYERAYECVTRASQINRTENYYLFRAEIGKKLGDDNRVEQDFKQALMLEPENGTIYRERALWFVECSRYKDAEKDFRAALELEANDSGYYFYWLGKVLGYQQNNIEAEKFYKKAMEDNTSDEKVAKLSKIGLGRLLVEQGKFDQAFSIFDQYIGQYSDDSVGYCLMTSLLKKQDRIEEAKIYCEKALQVDPENKYVHHLKETLGESRKREGSARRGVSP